MLQPINCSTVPVRHLLETAALPGREMAAALPTHPSFGAMQPHFEKMKPASFRRRELAVLYASANALFLTMLALVYRLGDCRQCYPKSCDCCGG